MRLNQYLATAGIGSRRSVEALIRQSRVTVNGQVASLQTRVDTQQDAVMFDGRPVKLPGKFTYLILNKPPGYTVTRTDPRAARTVYEILPPDCRQLAHVGRLDRDSEGLLLFTNNGPVNQRLLSPASEVPKTYHAYTTTNVSKASMRSFTQGITLDDGTRYKAREASFRQTPANGGVLRIVLTEGRKREVRRMCEYLNIDIQRLQRVSFGPIHLDRLPLGKTRRLSEKEIGLLEAAVSDKKDVPKPDTIA